MSLLLSSPPPPPFPPSSLSLPQFVLLRLSLFLLSHPLSFIDTDSVLVTPYGLDWSSFQRLRAARTHARRHPDTIHTVPVPYTGTLGQGHKTQIEDRRTGREATSWTDRRPAPGKTNQTGKHTHILTTEHSNHASTQSRRHSTHSFTSPNTHYSFVTLYAITIRHHTIRYSFHHPSACSPSAKPRFLLFSPSLQSSLI